MAEQNMLHGPGNSAVINRKSLQLVTHGVSLPTKGATAIMLALFTFPQLKAQESHRLSVIFDNNFIIIPPTEI
ncbi:hypothetical protein BDW22DRAFT_735117 [Trametopsis cervina]|nr:hypothetical protein BDW22DRAFT_735117 [Trametopsis cervina]